MQTIAWKTGTSYGFRDAWAVGVTPRYAVGVWVGNATGEGKPGLVGAQTAGPVLFDILICSPSSSWFERPDSILSKQRSAKSGHLKGRFCDETDTFLFYRQDCGQRHAPITISSLYQPMKASVFMKIAPPRSLRFGKSWFTLPPVWEWYYKQHHPEYKPLPF